MVRCRPAVDEQALADLKADLEKPHMARVPGARALLGVTYILWVLPPPVRNSGCV